MSLLIRLSKFPSKITQQSLQNQSKLLQTEISHSRTRITSSRPFSTCSHYLACKGPSNEPILGPTQPVDLTEAKVDAEIAQILITKFNPDAIQVINQSKMHSRGDQTHYKVILAGSDILNSMKRPVKQQQAVLKELKDTMYRTTLHSVSMKILKTEQDMREEDKVSPGCANHGKK